MKILKVNYVLEKEDGSDIDQKFVNKFSDDFIEFVESQKLVWCGHFDIIEKEKN